MTKRSDVVKNVRFRGRVEYHGEALALLERPEDCVLVTREVDRELVMKCPDGCGDTLTVNLDSRAGPAWEVYVRRNAVSLYPSVWRETGCESHFMLINNHIYGFGFSSIDEIDLTDAFVQSVLQQFEDRKKHSYYEIARELREMPWDVYLACERLVKAKKLEKAGPKNKGIYLMREKGKQ